MKAGEGLAVFFATGLGVAPPRFCKALDCHAHRASPDGDVKPVAEKRTLGVSASPVRAAYPRPRLTVEVEADASGKASIRERLIYRKGAPRH